MSAIKEFRKLIIYEDNHLLVVDKPHGIAVQGAVGESIYSSAKNYLKITYQKPGDAWLGIVHRLDQATAGVVVLAKTSKAAGRLSAQFRDKTVSKFYCCILEGKIKKNSALLQAWLKKSERTSQVQKKYIKGFKKALLKYRVIKKYEKYSFCSVNLLTGYYHQIRAQFSSEGYPVLGDLKYAAREKIGRGKIALLCRKMIIKHPVTDKKTIFKSRQEIQELVKNKFD